MININTLTKENIGNWVEYKSFNNIEKGRKVNAAGVLQLNQWQEQTSIQMVIRDLQPVTNTDQ